MTRRSPVRFALALLSSCVMVMFADLLDGEAEFVMLLVPVVIWAHVGLTPGLIAMATTTIGAAMTPVDGADHVQWLTPLVVGGLVNVLCENVRRSRARLVDTAHRAVQLERRFSESFHASPVPMALTRLDDHVVTDVNSELARLVGWSREELVGRSLVELGVIRSEEQARLARRARRSGIVRNHAIQLRGNQANLRDVIVSKDVLLIDGEAHTLTTFVDHTERMRAESALRSSDERFRELAETIGEAFWIMNLERTKVLYVSPAYDTIWGRSRARLYDAPDDWMTSMHPVDRERIAASQVAEPLPDNTIDEFRIIRPDKSVRWIRNRAFTVRDSGGQPVRIAGIAADITKHRELEDQLRQSQKMDSLGMLAGGIAHDFNNVLAVISSSNALLGEMLTSGGEERELVEEVASAVTRATTLTRQLLTFSRKQVTEPVVLDLNALVVDTQKMLRRVLGASIRLQTSLDPDLDRVRVDSGSLVQVLMNLAVNARDAIGRTGTLSISTRMVDGRVMLAIADTGCGMSVEVRERIFEPFYTTKEPGRGTGLGLSVVHGIVEQAAGHLHVASEVGHGTTFEISLPAISAPATRASTRIVVLPHGIETILLVDDDAFVRKATARALRSRGYTVIEACGGESALAALDEHPIDLLLTDVVMPNMDGPQLAAAVKARKPDVRVLYTSGYTDDEVVVRGVLRRELDLLEKPFELHTLAGKVRQVLDRDNGAICDVTAIEPPATN